MKNNGTRSTFLPCLLIGALLLGPAPAAHAQVQLAKNGARDADAPTPLSIVAQKLRNVAIKALNDCGYSDLVEMTVAGSNQPLGRWGKLATYMASGPSSAVGAGNSLLTVDLPPAPLAELVNVMDLYQSLFGITPDFSNVNDTSSFYKQVQDIFLASAPAIALDCQPSFRIWPQEINAGFPDQHSVAHFMVLPAFGPNDLVMIEGTFPAARYFSFQTYDANSAPVAFVRDAQIVPLANKRNPFATPPPTGRAGGGLEQAHYRIYLTKDGKRGFPNELAVAKSNFALGGLTIVVLRLYGVDPRADWSNRELAPWGFVPPVRVSAKIMGTFAPTATDIVWQTYPQCPLNNTLALRDALTALTNLVNMFDVAGKQSCLSENVRDNFLLYQPEEPEPPGLGLGVVPPGVLPPAPSRTPFPNHDAAFLVACAHNRPQYLKSNDLVAVVRGHLPRTPGGLVDAPVVGDPMAYHVRYASMSVVDLNLPGPVLRTVSDDEFRDFYRKRYGNATWELTYGRNVSVLVAKNRAVLARCGLDTSDSFVVELATHEPITDWFGVVYRELLPQGVTVKNSTTPPHAAARSTQPDDMPLYAESIEDAKLAVCGPDKTCDPSPYRVSQVMGMHMPRINYYLCSASGVLHVAPPATPDPFVGKGYPLLSDKLAGAGSDDEKLPEDVWACANQMGASNHVDGMVRAYSPAAWIHLHVDGRPVKVARPGQLGAWNLSVPATKDGLRPVVVGLSLKAKTAGEAAYLAEVEACGNAYVADPRWHCSNDPPLDDSWLLPTFVEGPNWKPATWAPCPDCATQPRSLAVVSVPGRGRRGKRQPQSKPTSRPSLPPTSPLHFFAKDNRRCIKPSPRLEQEAEAAWREWQQAKEDANSAWRAWRRAKEHPQQQQPPTNGTAGNGTREAMGHGKDGVTTTMHSATNASLSIDWKDHMNASAAGVTLQWAKPLPANIHGFYCRFVVGGGGGNKKAGRGIWG